MIKCFWFILFLAGSILNIYAQDINATTIDGKPVILKSNGTWAYLEREDDSNNATIEITVKVKNATEKIEGRFGNVTVWYDPNRWTVQKLTDGTAEYQFVALSGESYGRLISEKIQLTPDFMKKVIESNARRVSTIFDVLEEKEYIVNGTKVNYLLARVNMQGLIFIFCYYYWTGETGTIQLFSYTSESLYNQAKAEIFELMNGLEIE